MNNNRINDELSFRRGGGPGQNAIDLTNLPADSRGGMGQSGQEGVPGGTGEPSGEGGDNLSNIHSFHGLIRAIKGAQNPQHKPRGSLASRVKMHRFGQPPSSPHGMHIANGGRI